MTLLAFLHQLQTQKNVPAKPLLCFSARHYPLLFFSHLISFLQKNHVVVESVSLETMDAALIKANCATVSFAGQVLYWFHDFYALSTKKQQEWISYFQSYSGPHIVLFFSHEEGNVSLLKNKEHAKVITIPDEFSLQDISMIRFLIDHNVEKAYPSIDAGLHVQMVSLDTLCLLNHYELVTGKNWNSFLVEWGARIIEPTSSLFLLSQYFFSKKSSLFFTQWSHMHDIYMFTFWPTFWADQLWRAYIYCDLMHQKKYDQARSAQYKLPYSLIKRDWAQLQLQELQLAHDYLYKLDYRLKNGGSCAALELFFDKFFEGKFRV